MLYSDARTYLRGLDLINSHVNGIATVTRLVTVSISSADDVPTGADTLTLSGAPANATRWYRLPVYDDLPGQVQAATDHLEAVHRCVIYGCAAYGNAGVTSSGALTDYFIGSGGADVAIKV